MEYASTAQAMPSRPNNHLETAETALQQICERIRQSAASVREVANHLMGETSKEEAACMDRALPPTGGKIGAVHEQILDAKGALDYLEAQLDRLSQFQ